MRSQTNNPDGRGNDAWSDLLKRIMQRLLELQFFDSQTISWEQTTRGVRANVINPQFGGVVSGLQWQTPNKELDPSVAVAANTLVYISPQNPLATVGLVDLQSSGATLTATAGIWCSLRAVPAATSSGYNVPQDPIPDGGVTVPTGTPLVGDLDRTAAPLIYWVLIKSVC